MAGAVRYLHHVVWPLVGAEYGRAEDGLWDDPFIRDLDPLPYVRLGHAELYYEDKHLQRNWL